MARDSPKFDIKQLFTLCYCHTKDIATVLQYRPIAYFALHVTGRSSAIVRWARQTLTHSCVNQKTAITEHLWMQEIWGSQDLVSADKECMQRGCIGAVMLQAAIPCLKA